MATNSIYQLRVLFVDDDASDGFQIGLHYNATQNTILDTQAEDLIQAFRDDCEETLVDCIPTNTVLRAYSVVGITNPTEFADEATGDIGGDLAGTVLPYQISPLINWKTGLRGRSYRGRTFLPAATEEVQAAGVWSGGYLTVLQAFIDSALDVGNGIDTAIYDLVIWSPTLSIATKVVQGVPNAIAATQRRRKPGVGS